MQETVGLIPGSVTCPGKANATHSSTLAWERIDRGAWWATVHGSKRVRHNWAIEHTRAHKEIHLLGSCRRVSFPHRKWSSGKRWYWALGPHPCGSLNFPLGVRQTWLIWAWCSSSITSKARRRQAGYFFSNTIPLSGVKIHCFRNPQEISA